MPVQAPDFVSVDRLESEIQRRLAAERERLNAATGLATREHFHRPVERPFVGEERKRVTILFGGLTWKHEALIQAAFQGNGYNCVVIPTPNVAAFQLGKEFGNTGQCNPTYFTVGNLIQYLQGLEKQGMSRQEIIDRHVFFTAGSCGPCRFGMYEAEYRFALDNAGFNGFRVLLFQQQDGIKAASGEPGLKFTVNFGMSMLNALLLGDAMNDLVYQIRPFETRRGETDQIFAETVAQLGAVLRDRKPFELGEHNNMAAGILQKNRKIKDTFSVLLKVLDHLYGKELYNGLAAARANMDRIEVDRTKVKPVVKITGEFWAQITEGDGNFHMFRFLEREGAQVIVEPIATWVAYMIHQVRLNTVGRRRADSPYPDAAWYQLQQRMANELKFRQKWLALVIGEAVWGHFYHRLTKRLGGITHPLVPQKELAAMAHPFYNRLARGGEGHLEVGKNVYYTVHHLCHMVLGLKPFGCMPSSQSDGAQSAVVNRFKEMIYLPIETSGEGEVNAHSRVQMALGEAKMKAKAEFETALAGTGKSLEQIHGYIADHPELKRPFYPVPHRAGIAGTAAQFVWHVSDRMDRDAAWWRRTHVSLSRAPAAGAH
jgi:predicted nucleotide-binding protein (sugar kinase/HSP70/actin superfamily)